MWQVNTYLVVNMGTLVQLPLTYFSYFKSLFSLTQLYCVSFRFVCSVTFCLFSLKWHFRETRNFAKILFIFVKLRNSFRFRFAKISRNEIPLKTLPPTVKLSVIFSSGESDSDDAYRYVRRWSELFRNRGHGNKPYQSKHRQTTENPSAIRNKVFVFVYIALHYTVLLG